MKSNDVGVLNTIEKDFNDNEQCCSTMFQKWIQKDPFASWIDLIKALRVIKMNKVADDISKAYYHDTGM